MKSAQPGEARQGINHQTALVMQIRYLVTENAGKLYSDSQKVPGFCGLFSWVCGAGKSIPGHALTEEGRLPDWSRAITSWRYPACGADRMSSSIQLAHFPSG